jgi:hypothetical protein
LVSRGARNFSITRMKRCGIIRTRQRWGEERFGKIFKRTVEACLKAKITTAEVVHIDASLIRAPLAPSRLAARPPSARFDCTCRIGSGAGT